MTDSRKLPPVVVSPVLLNGTAVMRAFHKRGAHCVAVSSDPHVPGFFSRAASQKVHLADLETRFGAFSDWLLSRKDLHGALVIPTSDEIVADVDANRSRLEGLFRLCIPSAEVCRVALDKARLAVAAERAGVPGPQIIANYGTRRGKADDVVFPVIVKPCYSTGFSGAFGRKVAIAENERQLEEILAKCHNLGIEVVIQEHLAPAAPVASYNAYVRRSGEIAGDFTSLRLGMFPPITGTGFYETATLIKPLLEYGRRIIASLGYAGALVNMDFKRSAHGDDWRLLDLNARSWRQVSLAPLVGVDVIEHLIRDYLDLTPLANGPVRYGAHWFYLKSALFLRRAHPGEGPGVGDYLRLLWTKRIGGLLSLDDPRPFFADIKPLLMRRFRRPQQHPDRQSGAPTCTDGQTA